jgi:hypothetical protein
VAPSPTTLTWRSFDAPIDLFRSITCSITCPYDAGPLASTLLNPTGVHIMPMPTGELTLTLCKTCSSALHNGRTPPLALANRTFLIPVPNELKDLTPLEESMVARCRCWVVESKENNESLLSPFNQRGMKGHNHHLSTASRADHRDSAPIHR